MDLLFFHSALAATDPGRADVRLWIGEVELWHLEIPIPWGSGHHDLQLPAPESFAEGEPVYLHVSNHGANSYRFGRVYRRSEPGQ
ncbi:MAG: hypothetical protein EA397_06115 [Deltaproteobacteria bacterium]|nr:MAG: hypothetical protein EA397_06115 [Deltaproteobacteria bacterium]